MIDLAWPAVAVFALCLGSYHAQRWRNPKLDRLTARLGELETKVASLEVRGIHG
jgi:hypothetical protein